jgi:hypothetical protein
MLEEPLRVARVGLAGKARRRHDAGSVQPGPALDAGDGVLESATIAGGLVYRSERVPLINPQRGIFKPRGLPLLLSIGTVIPRVGARLCLREADLGGPQSPEGTLQSECAESRTVRRAAAAPMGQPREWVPGKFGSRTEITVSSRQGAVASQDHNGRREQREA